MLGPYQAQIEQLLAENVKLPRKQRYTSKDIYQTIRKEGYRGGESTVRLIERLETLNAAAQQLSYILLTDTPFGNCLTSMAVRDLGPNQAELAWSATFQPAGIPVDEADGLLEGALAANCLALKQFMEIGGWE